MATPKNGDLIKLQVGGYTLVGQKTGNLSMDVDMLPATTKDSAGHKEYFPGWDGFTMSVNNLYFTDAASNTGLADVVALLKAKAAVTVGFGGLVAGDVYYTGSGFIQKCDIKGDANTLVDYTLNIQGTGDLTPSIVGASSSACDFTDFDIQGVTKRSSTIVTGGPTIAVHVTTGTTLTALIARFRLSPGATCKIGLVPQIDGVTSNDFSGAVTYIVTAQNGSTQKSYVVTTTADL